MEPSAGAGERRAAVAIGLWFALVLGLGLLLVPALCPLAVVDERWHLLLIQAIAAGEFSFDLVERLRLPMLPGYHALMAALGYPLGLDLAAVRAVSLLHSLLLVPVAIAAARARSSEHARARALEVLLIPYLPLLCWLVYTDAASLLYVLLGYLCWSRERMVLAGIALTAACLVRQNNVVWAAALAAVSLVEALAAGPRGEVRPLGVLRAQALRLSPLALPFAVVAALVLSRGALVAGNRPFNAPAPHPTQVWFQALLFLGWLAPQVAADLGRQARAWRARLAVRPLAWAALVLAVAVAFHLSLEVTHRWNVRLHAEGGRVEVLDVLFGRLAGVAAGRVALFAAFWVLVDHLVEETRRSSRPALLAVLLLAAPLYWLPSWMLSYRYGLVPLALHALASEVPATARAGGPWWQVGLTAATSAAFLSGAIMR
jgi:hypothetical protein